MAVAYQTQKKGQQPAGLELFDISVPEKPRSISFFDCSGEHSRGVHQLWFCDGEYVHMASGAADFTPSHPIDDQFYRCIDVRNPSKPVEAGRWWIRARGQATTTRRRRAIRSTRAIARTTPMSIRSGRTGSISPISTAACSSWTSPTRRNPKPISHWTNSPPYTGFMHTVVPLFERNLLIVTDELTENNAKDWPKLIWILDNRDETHPVPIATCPLPPVDAYKDRGGRFGAHNIYENMPVPTAWQSDQIVLGTFFNGGLRAYDISNPYQPKEVAAFVPPAPKGTPAGAMQLNDVLSTSGRSSTPSTASPAGSICWRWIFDLCRRPACGEMASARSREPGEGLFDSPNRRCPLTRFPHFARK